MSTTFAQTKSTTFEVWPCPNCGVDFAVTVEFANARRADCRSVWCPNGHTMSYRETEADRLKRELAQARQSAEGARDEARRQREHRQAAERRVTAMKGVVTRTKKRIAKGKCVRCSCEFPDLAEHMATEHPDYDPDVVE